MIRFILPILLIFGSASMATADNSFLKLPYLLEIEDGDGYYGYSEPGGGYSEPGEYPNCNDVGDDFIGECVDPEPVTAPDNCNYYDWTYDPEIYLHWGCG